MIRTFESRLMMTLPNRRFLRPLAGVVLPAMLGFALLLTGCGGSGEPLPTTFEVKGNVLLASGQPMQGGLVEFRSTTDPALRTTGRIQDDGAFTLSTMVASGEKTPGAPAGTYRVTIMPMMSAAADQQHMATPLTLPDTFDVKAEGENDFTLQWK